MTLGDFGLITIMGLLWTIFGSWSGAWWIIPLAASYTAMMVTLSAERIAQFKKEQNEKEPV